MEQFPEKKLERLGAFFMIRDAETIPSVTPSRSRTGFILQTSGDPLNALHRFMQSLWEQEDLQALLVPVQSPGCHAVFPQVLTDPEQLSSINPFAPVMTVNSSGLIDDLLQAYPQGRLAVVLRPCELRTWIEICKRRKASNEIEEVSSVYDRLLLISVDCPGTLNAVDFAHQAAATGIAELTCQALNWATHSRWINSRLREACQRCEWPMPMNADLVIGTLGLNSEEILLLVPAEKEYGDQLQIEDLVDELVSEDVWLRRSSAASLVMERRNSYLPGGSRREGNDPANLLATFARCTMCTDCLDACPLYDGELASMLGIPGPGGGTAPILVSMVGISRWLASCSGCGMCQESCNQEIPLLNIVLGINQRIRSQLDYHPGDPAQPLPWL